MRRGKVGLQLGRHQKYYISRCEEKQSIQLTITVEGSETSAQERRQLINDVTELLGDIMEVFMPAAKKPVLLVPCALCSTLHITFSNVVNDNTIYCAIASSKDVLPLPAQYYSDLIQSKSGYLTAKSGYLTAKPGM